MIFDSDICPVAGVHHPVNILITGASSGIGLAMVRQLLVNRHVASVFSVSRTAASNDALQGLTRDFGEKLINVDADITSELGLRSVVESTQSVDALDLVINCAGVLHGAGLSPEKSIEHVSKASLEQVFALNAFAPLLLAQALLPQLCRKQPSVFASLSARVGSIGDNRAGGWYAYRASKAAQNQLLKTFSIEWKRRNPQSICLLLHPGTVDTPLSTPFQSKVPADKLFDTQRAARQILSITSQSSPADSGRFIAWDGTDIPW